MLMNKAFSEIRNLRNNFKTFYSNRIAPWSECHFNYKQLTKQLVAAIYLSISPLRVPELEGAGEGRHARATNVPKQLHSSVGCLA
jgi:hypothetical protein